VILGQTFDAAGFADVLYGASVAPERETHAARDVAQTAAWCTALLAQIDTALHLDAGECAMVLAQVFDGTVVGGSVGDCVAWIVGDRVVQELTATQERKPLLGSGTAVPVAFEAPVDDSTLLVASDGLWKYAPRVRIAQLARQPDLATAAREISELPRLRSGALPGDVAVLLCRRRD
jgi:hypothetical protein